MSSRSPTTTSRRCSWSPHPEQLRALADPLRDTLLELLLERAATVTEMAKAVDRPKSTIAYHVNLLVDAGLLRVVRTRRVRAIEERYYGRVARTLYIGVLSRPEDKRVAAAINGLAQAAAESGPAHVADELRCTLLHARIPIEEVRNLLGTGPGARSHVRPDPPGRRPGLRLRRRSVSDRRAHAPRPGGDSPG